MKKLFLLLAAVGVIFTACEKTDGLDNNQKKVPTDEIWYTSSDGAVVEPYANNVFGANIVSNTYENGKGIIKFDSDITTIGDCAFQNCSSLITIAIPDSVTSIGTEAFWHCTSLTNITIPDSVTKIRDIVFYKCTSLKEVYCKPATPPTGGDDMFSYYDAELSTIRPIGCKIYVPIGSGEEYKKKEYWSDYAGYIEEKEF